MNFRKFVAGILSRVLGSGPTKLHGDEYAFILKARGNPYWQTMAEGIRDTAKARGIKAVIYLGEQDSDAEGFIAHCMTAIQRKPKVMVMAAVNPDVAVQCLKQATAAGIIVADIDGNISVEDAQKAGIKLAFSVGSDNFLIGQEAAEFAANLLKNSKSKVFVLEGAAENMPNQQRIDGFRAKLRELVPNADVVASISAEWDQLKAKNTTADILQKNPDIEVIYAVNDTMALGAAEAVRNSGKSEKVKIIGVDATAEARKAILEGHMTASVAQLSYLMGLRATELAIEAAQKPPAGLTEVIQTPLMTKESIASEKDPLNPRQ